MNQGLSAIEGYLKLNAQKLIISSVSAIKGEANMKTAFGQARMNVLEDVPIYFSTDHQSSFIK